MQSQNLTELLCGLQKKHFSAEELTRYYLSRIERDSLNCFITVDHEGAIAKAREIDQRYHRGESAPLLGIPIAHKDLFCTKGLATTCASRMLEHFIAPYDAHIVSALKNAGTVLLGKTNMDEFAMGSSNETSYFGAVKNPWDHQRVPGGSSGGSAAAVAARLVPVATGSDTGGSIRQPASFCGITGLKPTYGLASRYGMVAYASSLDQAGPMAVSAEDVAYLLNVMVGFDARDSTSLKRPAENYTKSLAQSPKGLRIGVPRGMLEDNLDPAIRTCLIKALGELERIGLTVTEIELPHLSMSIPTYFIIAFAECSSNLARFDGVRYGYRCAAPKNLNDLYRRTRSEGFGREAKRRIMVGTFVLSSGYYDAYYRRAQQIRHLILRDFQKAFRTVDAIFQPASPSVAFRLGEKISDPIAMYLSDVYTVSANLAGLPAICFPAGFSQNLPVGAQLLGNHFSEAALLRIAHSYQQQTDWHRRQPNAATP